MKALNTVNHKVMVEPSLIAGDHDLFVAGDDEAAKTQAIELLEGFGWPRGRVVDLGGIDGARAMEMYLPLWVRLSRTFGTPDVNVRVAR